eukprot:1629170-Rhodomonas_salina.2
MSIVRHGQHSPSTRKSGEDAHWEKRQESPKCCQRRGLPPVAAVPAVLVASASPSRQTPALFVSLLALLFSRFVWHHLTVLADFVANADLALQTILLCPQHGLTSMLLLSVAQQISFRCACHLDPLHGLQLSPWGQCGGSAGFCCRT